ncbi:MAG: ribose ABC transporter permease [Veillonella sp.]|nr:ribose ABC transporter permease [Veillonella sp.]
MDSKALQYVKKLGPLIGLILLFIIISVMNDSFLEFSNLRNLLRQVSINAIIAFGMTFVILTGGIDLSVGSILALSSAVMANLIVTGTDPVLATMTIYRGATLVFTDGNPISGLTQDPLFHGFGQGDIAGLPVPAITMFLAFIALWFVLSRTSLGRKTYAVGGSEKVSYIAGIKIDRVKIFVYALTGMLCGIAGAIITSRLNSAQPTAGAGYELDAIAAVVLGGTSLAGGRGHIVGTLIGALIIGTLNNGLNILDVSSFYQQVVKGIVILLAVLADRKKA